jgi:hypothetical protein
LVEAELGLRQRKRQQCKQDNSSSAAPPRPTARPGWLLSQLLLQQQRQRQQAEMKAVSAPPACLHDLLATLPALSVVLGASPGAAQQLLAQLHHHLQQQPFLVTAGHPRELWWWPCLSIADLDLPQGNGLFLCPAAQAPQGFSLDIVKPVTVKLWGLTAGVDHSDITMSPAASHSSSSSQSPPPPAAAATGQRGLPGSWQQLGSFHALLSYRYRASCEPWLALGPVKCLAGLAPWRGWHLLRAELVRLGGRVGGWNLYQPGLRRGGLY